MECNRSGQCTSGHCASGACVQCTQASHCPGDDACNDPTCTGNSCGLIRLTGVLCGSGQVCNNGSCEHACGNGRLDTAAGEECEPGVGGYNWYTCDPATCQTRTWYTNCASDLYCESPSTCDMNAHLCLPACPMNNVNLCQKPQPVLDAGGNPTMICGASKCAMGCMGNIDCPSHLRCLYSGPVGFCSP